MTVVAGGTGLGSSLPPQDNGYVYVFLILQLLTGLHGILSAAFDRPAGNEMDVFSVP